MKHLVLLTLIGALLISSCSNSKHRILSTVEINGKSVPLLKFNEVKDTISLSLSQLLDDVSFIKLETKNDNKLTGGKWTIGNKYLVVYCRRMGLFQFGSDGRFLRKLADYGNGPQEVYYPIWAISKGESHIYIYDSNKPKSFLCIDLNSGIFTKTIPIALEGLLKNMFCVNDSVLVCAPIGGSGSPAANYSLFWQNLSGEFIRGIPARNNSKPIVPSENILYMVSNNLHYRPANSDTIFLVNEYKMEPYFILDTNNNSNNSVSDIGQTTIEIFAEANDFFIIKTNNIQEKKVIGQTTYDSGTNKYYYVNKVSNRAYLITLFYNDLTGGKQEPVFFQDQTSYLKYVSIDAFSLLKKINIIKSDSGIRIKSRDAFINLGVGMTENDNPILLVGKFINE